VGDGVKAAAAVLGWNVKVIPNDYTPAGYTEAWKQIAQDPGDGVINASAALPYSAVKQQVDEANVPIVGSTSPDPVGGKLLAVVSSEKDIHLQGEVEANWVIQDAKEPVKSVYVYDPQISALRSAWPGYQDAMKKNCPACEVESLEVQAAQIGPALAQQVVSYLQANPDVKYVAFGLGDLAIGVPAALKASGLQDQVKLTTRAAGPSNFEDVESGGMSAAFTAELYEAGWRTVDLMARTFTDTPIDDPYPLGVIRMITKDNLPSDITVPYSLPDYEAVFKTAWGVS
jgi:ribose transport system substrate-binding protein